jgi:hypothetical protein
LHKIIFILFYFNVAGLAFKMAGDCADIVKKSMRYMPMGVGMRKQTTAVEGSIREEPAQNYYADLSAIISF